MPEKIRLDIELVKRNLSESREKARKSIVSGGIEVNGRIISKPAEKVSADDEIKVLVRQRYVGRGGYKLEKALKFFNISVEGLTTCDVGASTGGFTDCLLQHGAAKVYAVDVGENQLHKDLRIDTRVVNLEHVNFRDIDTSIFIDSIDFACVDVSFISLKYILPSLRRVLEESSEAVLLVKPQFETGIKNVGKNGIVRDIKAHVNVLNEFLEYAGDSGFSVKGITFSPITGGDGNIEYLAHIGGGASAKIDVKSVTDEAFSTLRQLRYEVQKTPGI